MLNDLTILYSSKGKGSYNFILKNKVHMNIFMIITSDCKIENLQFSNNIIHIKDANHCFRGTFNNLKFNTLHKFKSLPYKTDILNQRALSFCFAYYHQKSNVILNKSMRKKDIL